MLTKMTIDELANAAAMRYSKYHTFANISLTGSKSDFGIIGNANIILTINLKSYQHIIRNMSKSSNWFRSFFTLADDGHDDGQFETNTSLEDAAYELHEAIMSQIDEFETDDLAEFIDRYQIFAELDH